MTKNLRNLWILAIPAVAAMVAGGCASDPSEGYTTANLYRPGIRTVAVPIWDTGSNVYRRGLEDRLTEALIKRITSATPYEITDKSKADTVLKGTIVAVRQRVLSFDPDFALPRDEQLLIVVNFTWTDERTGEILAERKRFRASGLYYPTAPYGEESAVGSVDAINRLAERIVETMEAPW